MRFLTLVTIALVICSLFIAATGGAIYVAAEIDAICTPYGSFRLLGNTFTCAAVPGR